MESGYQKRNKKKSPPGTGIWPAGFEPDWTNIPVGIARTYPAWKDYPAVREVEKMHLDSIESAEKYIYIENQYLTSVSVCNALEKKLQKENGPEIIIVTTKRDEGWIEENTMGILRSRFFKKLTDANLHGRLMLLYPSVVENGYETLITVHAKIIIIDSLFFHVGSANLNNRSMGVDSECDIAIEADGNEEISRKIQEILLNLLSSHLSVPFKEAEQVLKSSGSVLEVIKKFQGKGKSLYPIATKYMPFMENVLPIDSPVDPAEPINLNTILNKFKPEEDKLPKYSAAAKLFIPILILLIIAAMWEFIDMKAFIRPDKIAPYLAILKNGITGFLAVIGIYVIGSILMIPITIMIVLTAIIFGPVMGFLYAMAGTIASAYITYMIGKFLWRDTIRKMVGDKLQILNSKLKKQSIIIIAALRIVPVAPFTIVNMVAGSSRIKLHLYLAGTFVGMLPGNLALSVFSDRAYSAIRDPDPVSIAVTLSILLVLILFTIQIKKYIVKFFKTEEQNQNRENTG